MTGSGSNPSVTRGSLDLAILPKEAPPFTMADIQKAIPAHLFERSTLKSLLHLAVDLAELAFGLWVAITFLVPMQNPILAAPLWIAWWFWQGATMTGLWVLAHECGHESFSQFNIVNDVVGFVLHSALLVPFFSWRYSHAKHHHYTNHMEKDEVFTPPKLTKNDPLPQAPSTLRTAVTSVVMILIGWYMYLTFNSTGPVYPGKPLVSHWDPNAVIFKEAERFYVLVSNVGMLLALGSVAWAAYAYSFALVVKLYVIPLLVTNWWLVSITFLQHTHVDVPHYDSEEWTWLRGALCTVDRSLGPWLNYKTHHITDSHVVHHIFSKMPFYNAIEATRHVKKVLGKYHADDTPNGGFFHFVHSFFVVHATCHYVKDEGEGSGILYWAPFRR